MQELLNNAVQELKRKGLSPTPHLLLTEVIEGTQARLETFSPDFFRQHLGWALWFAHHRGLKLENFGCLQLLWPDKNGHFPMDEDCNAEVRRIQTPTPMNEKATFPSRKLGVICCGHVFLQCVAGR